MGLVLLFAFYFGLLHEDHIHCFKQNAWREAFLKPLGDSAGGYWIWFLSRADTRETSRRSRPQTKLRCQLSTGQQWFLSCFLLRFELCPAIMSRHWRDTIIAVSTKYSQLNFQTIPWTTNSNWLRHQAQNIIFLLYRLLWAQVWEVKSKLCGSIRDSDCVEATG